MKFFLQILSLSVLLISCRQEIVPPDNPAGNINEPVYTRTNFSYSFAINASRITRTVIDNTYLNTTSSRIYLVISDHSSGSVEIKVQNDNNFVLYSSVFDNDTDGIFRELDGYQPNIITLNFIDFTGKFKFTLTDRE
jgi:hypothetical protein